MLTRLMVVACLGGVAMASCKAPTELNRPCRLVKKNPDGGAEPVPLLEGDLKANAGHGKDFISVATPDCDSQFCVRDSLMVTDAGPFDPAFGYCSSACLAGATTGCESYDPALDTGTTKLTCRALLLDATTLSTLAQDGGSPGNVRDPYFCARGETPDGGL